MFTEVCGREFGNAVIFGAGHQLTVDAYAVEHTGGQHPDKSICIHLCGLSLVFERGLKPPAVAPVLQRIASAIDRWPHFTPPADSGALTIADIVDYEAPEAHINVAMEWSKQVWDAWAEHHTSIHRLILSHGVFP